MSAAALAAATGCSFLQPEQNPSGSVGADLPRPDVQGLLDRFVSAGRTGDVAAYKAEVDPSDPAFVAVSTWWFANLGRLPWSELRLRALSSTTDLTAARTGVLGTGAWSQQVEVRWCLVGSTRTAVQSVWLTFSPSAAGGARLAGWDDRASEEPTAAPLWLLQPLVAERGDRVLVLAADAQTARRWVVPAVGAARSVRREVPADLRRGDEVLTVQVPTTQEAFEHVLGVDSGTYASIAGAAWPLGPDPGSAPVPVVLNPAVADRLPASGVDVLLTHEATHVAVDSPGSAAPTWLVEGYADAVAYRAHPATRVAAARPALDRVRAGAAPSRLPADADFGAQGAALDVAYAQAWLLCLAIADRYGWVRLAELYGAADRGTAVPDALRSTLGTTETALLRDWRATLQRWTDRPPW